MKHQIRHFLLPFLIVLGLMSCETNDCTLYNVVALNVAFYANGKAVALTDTLTVTALGANAPLLNKKPATSKMALPLSYWNDTDTLVLHLLTENGILRDTIWVDKTNLTHYETPDCPATQFHGIKELRSTHVFIENLVITRPSVDYETTENIQIHLFSSPEPDPTPGDGKEE